MRPSSTSAAYLLLVILLTPTAVFSDYLDITVRSLISILYSNKFL